MQNKAGIAGILSIVSGVFGMIWLGYAFLLNYWLKAMPQFFGANDPLNFSDYWFRTMGVIYIIGGSVAAMIGVFAIVAGIFTLKRIKWGLAVAGAIASTIIFFPCGIPAIMLISGAQNEF
jgi:hypothetical protein